MSLTTRLRRAGIVSSADFRDQIAHPEGKLNDRYRENWQDSSARFSGMRRFAAGFRTVHISDSGCEVQAIWNLPAIASLS